MAKSDTPEKQVQETVDQEQEQGYRGVRTDPNPPEAYSLTTGPDSPPAVENTTTRLNQPTVEGA